MRWTIWAIVTGLFAIGAFQGRDPLAPLILVALVAGVWAWSLYYD